MELLLLPADSSFHCLSLIFSVNLVIYVCLVYAEPHAFSSGIFQVYLWFGSHFCFMVRQTHLFIFYLFIYVGVLATLV